MAAKKREIKSRACIKTHKGCHLKEREAKKRRLVLGSSMEEHPRLRAQGVRNTQRKALFSFIPTLGTESEFITAMCFRKFKTKKFKKVVLYQQSVRLGKSIMSWCCRDALTNWII